MDIVVFTPRDLPIALGALRALQLRLNWHQQRLLSAVARLHGAALDIDALPWPSHETTRAALSDARRRKRLVQLALVLTMVGREVTPAAARAVADLARALSVNEPAIATLTAIAHRRLFRARISLMRRVMGKFIGRAVRERRWRDAGAIVARLIGRDGDPVTAARYRTLAAMPVGSLGRKLWDHCAERGFALPGERGAIPEAALFHDIGHLLAGYDTDPAGEIQQAAFQAGFVREDGFTFLFFGLLQFHLGIRVTPVADAAFGHFDAYRVVAALARGAACKADLSDGWDFWQHAPRPLERLRAELGIVPAPPVAPARPNLAVEGAACSQWG